VSLFATEKLPSPHEAIGVVSNDLPQRTLSVRISDNESGYARLLWRECFQALRRSEEAGRHGDSTVWASTPQAYQVAHAATGDAAFGGTLVFRFRQGEASYAELVGRPGLTAGVWLDRSRRRFINVVFKHRS